LQLKKHPLHQGKEATFWHFITKGEEEAERIPDLRRCERIKWPKPIIENNGDMIIKTWENVRNGEKRILLFIEEENYLVVLAGRNGYLLPWTAYYGGTSRTSKKN
jgi:hypothetical protein